MSYKQDVENVNLIHVKRLLAMVSNGQDAREARSLVFANPVIRDFERETGLTFDINGPAPRRCEHCRAWVQYEPKHQCAKAQSVAYLSAMENLNMLCALSEAASVALFYETKNPPMVTVTFRWPDGFAFDLLLHRSQIASSPLAITDYLARHAWGQWRASKVRG